MTDQQRPITPPPELVQQWYDEARDVSLLTHKIEQLVAVRAAQWGADQELEACCEWLQHDYPNIGATALRAARRPKPPSLKEQALEILAHAEEGWKPVPDDFDIIRRALKALPND